MSTRKHNKYKTVERFPLILVFVLFVLLGASACQAIDRQQGAAFRIEREAVDSGDIEQGRQLLHEYGCGACHTIPGVSGAHALVGPPLNGWSQRSYIAGRIPNTLDNLLTWIVNPQWIDPNTAMPDMDVVDEDAVHMSAYLYSLKD